MNLTTKSNDNVVRIFHSQWNSNTQNKIKMAQKKGLRYIEIPFHWGTLRYLYKGNIPEADICTVAFKIDMNYVPATEFFSKQGKRKIKQLKRFLRSWVLRNRDLDDSEISYYHKKYVYNYCTVSVPTFLRSRLLATLKAFGFKYTELTPQYMTLNCPVCEEKFKFETNKGLATCPNCGAQQHL